MLRNIIQLLVSAINIYSTLCFIRIILTWIPNAQYTGFGQFLSALCDPFLNMFRGIRWLQVGNIDFSPVLSIGLLHALSSILGHIARTGKIYVGGIFAIIISMFWSIISPLIGFLLILFIVRFVVTLSQKSTNYYGSFWARLDYTLEPLAHRIAGPFTRGNKFISYKTSLLISILVLIAIYVCGQMLINFLIKHVQQLPF
ncbi:MAG: YggT family protein [Treponema sp.]|nr:YggT family protein [Treponema sp.]